MKYTEQKPLEITKPSQLFTSGKQWTKGAYARDNSGNYVGVNSPKAACWCMT